MKNLRTLALLGLASLLTTSPAYSADDVILKAMKDELQRSMKLSFGSLDTPYYLEYTLDDATHIQISASFDGLLSVEKNDMRYPRVHLRIGSAKFDNTNYAGGRGAYGTRSGAFPLDDDYDNLRRSFWLATDISYKTALEAISRKRAGLKNLSVTEELPDFSPAKQSHLVLAVKPAKLDPQPWVARVKALASQFLQFPELHGSTVEYSAIDGVHRMESSEGGELRIPEQESELKITAYAQAADGMLLRDTILLNSFGLDGLPREAELQAMVADLGKTVTLLAKAPRGEDYSGPVLFEGMAAAQLFAELLGKNLALTRKPVTDPGGQGGGGQASELEGRIGSRILPESFSLRDDPTLSEWKGVRLFGTVLVDEEGIEPKPLTLVEKGVLKNYLLTRTPVRGFPETNGRSRLQGAFGNTLAGPTNLIVESKDTVPHAQLKAKLIEMLKQRDKPFGMIVRKMDFPSTAAASDVRRMMGGGRSGSARPVSLPLRLYRVYADGHEELVRGMHFRSLNVRSLKDILAAGDDTNVLNYLENGQIFALVGAASETAETSVVAPSILIDDLELARSDEELQKLPLVPAPDLVSSTKASAKQ